MARRAVHRMKHGRKQSLRRNEAWLHAALKET